MQPLFGKYPIRREFFYVPEGQKLIITKTNNIIVIIKLQNKQS